MKKIFLIFILLCFQFSPLFAAVEIRFWHSLAGHLGAELKLLVEKFNKEHPDYLIIPIYKGEYTDSLTSFAAAFRAHKPPQLIQVFEVGTSLVSSPRGIIKPLADIFEEQGKRLNSTHFLPSLVAFYSKDGKLQALPFNTSIPVLYYNADVLLKFNINSTNFPQTWEEIESLAKKLKERGFPCAYTSAYPAWIHIEAFSALHGLPLTEGGKAVYANNALRIHLERLRRWQKLGYFIYGGRTNESTVFFSSNYCPIFAQSSGAYQSLKGLVKFKLGVAPIPLESGFGKKRHNNAIGGAAIWAISEQNSEIYKGIAEFFSYLIMPETQESWLEHTGYLPLQIDSRLAADSLYPTLRIASEDLSAKEIRTSLAAIPQNHLRIINDEALEAIFSGIKTPKKALQNAVSRADLAIKRFRRNSS